MPSQVHSSYFKPMIFPYNGDIAPANIDRAQTIDPSAATNWEKVEEIGREGIVGHLKKIPTIGYRLTQYEYGTLEFWRKITNKSDATTSLTLADFKTSAFDIVAYLTDDDSTVVGSLVYPELRTAGFSIGIGDPDSIIERNFDFVGEQCLMYQGDNKYYQYQSETIVGSGTDEVITLDYTATIDPDTDDYMQRVLRVQGGVTTEITSFVDTSTTVTIPVVTAGDVIKLYYTSTSAYPSIFPVNDTDASGILADSADVYLYIPASDSPSSSDRVYRLQSATLDVRFDREDVKEIGNRKVVKRGVRDKTVTVTLGRILNDWTIEEVLRGEGEDYGIINVDKMTDSATLILRIFSDSTHNTFLYGFTATGLAPRDIRPGAAVNEYVKAEDVMEGEDLTITSVNPI